ncbi:MAG: UTP--glucose-1-phosphate uridylyltransferase [Desulfobulbaceae bacterium]
MDEKQIRFIQRAARAWQSLPEEAESPLTAEQVAKYLLLAESIYEKASVRRESDHHSAVIVTKAPHAGSKSSLIQIITRCLAFGLHISTVSRRSASEAIQIAHALYPDVWLNYSSLALSEDSWTRFHAKFDNGDFYRIFGVRFSRALVVTARKACEDNSLTQVDLAVIWQTGRKPLTREVAEQNYGIAAARHLMAGEAQHSWYRTSQPIGIQKIDSGIMAFALRHPRLYSGRPTILVNGHFALLSERFSNRGQGAVVLELGLDSQTSIWDYRSKLVGASDRPEECQPGSIRRDAFDGYFIVDSPADPVTPWANVVHASDGYLAGYLETIHLLGELPAPKFDRCLVESGYTRNEIVNLIVPDPVVQIGGDTLRLTRITAGLPFEDCLAKLQTYMPALRTVGPCGNDAFPLSELLAEARREDLSGALEQAVTENVSRRPKLPVQAIELGQELLELGTESLAESKVALLVPLAGSGGRFGGYAISEGSGPRLKPLLPLFELHGYRLCALDIRAAHVRYLCQSLSSHLPLFLSCSHHTEQPVKQWIVQNDDLDVEFGRVPECYRISMLNDPFPAEDFGVVGKILRDQAGVPLLKPSGSMGLLLAVASSGVLGRWESEGISVVAASNADDVGFRLAREVIGLLRSKPDLDAVVLTIPVRRQFQSDWASKGDTKGGILRERRTGRGWSAYIEENGSIEEGMLEHFNTNQIYFRLRSLRQALEDFKGDVRTMLPLYYERKEVKVNGVAVHALHAYQPFCEVLRLLSNVLAVSIQREPTVHQRRAFCPLKRQGDVQYAQSALDALDAYGDELRIQVANC